MFSRMHRDKLKYSLHCKQGSIHLNSGEHKYPFKGVRTNALYECMNCINIFILSTSTKVYREQTQKGQDWF